MQYDFHNEWKELELFLKSFKPLFLKEINIDEYVKYFKRLSVFIKH